MKFLRSSLILLVVAVIGGAYLFFAERDAPSGPGRLLLLAATPGSVQRIQFSPAALQLHRDGNIWKIFDAKAQFEAPANPEQVKELLSKLERVESDAPVFEPGKPEAYGLQKPAARLEVDGRTLFFGDKPPFDSGRVYARGKTGIGLLPLQLLQATQRPFSQWRDNAVLRFELPVSNFWIQNPQERIELKKNEGVWHILPSGVRADDEVVSALLSILGAARVVGWLDQKGEQAAKYGLGKPRAAIGIGDFRLEIGREQPGGNYAARNSASKSIFLVNKEIAQLLGRPLSGWRDRRIAIFSMGEITRLEITQGTRIQILVRESEGWRRENGPGETKADALALDILEWARNQRGVDLMETTDSSPGRWGLENPFMLLRAFDGNGALAFELRLGRVGKTLYAQSQIRNAGFASASTVWKLEPEAMDTINSLVADVMAGKR